ncbi:MAG: AI-2E family transporter [Gammaproteobacteria bacterium]
MAVTAQRIENVLTIAALALLVGGCLAVLAPFVSALLWAVILTFSTWAIFTRVLRLCGGRRTLAALAMTVMLALLLVAPLLLVATRLGENVNTLAGALRGLLDTGLPAPPAWLAGVPGIGPYLHDYWQSLRVDPGAHGSEALAWLQAQAKPITTWLLKRGLDIGQAVLQLTLSVFAAFYLYRDGVSVVARFSAGMERIAGRRAQALIDLAARTVRGVVYGILGTSLAQGLAAGIGFSLAGIPGPLFLGLLTSVLSLVPVGPPLVWIPATLWLLREGSPGWATFMGLWGFFVISGIDNLVKPWLISQGAALPFLIVLLGVIGGVLAFGFIGVFLGPTLLAVGFAVLREWTRGSVSTPSLPGATGDGAESRSREV